MTPLRLALLGSLPPPVGGTTLLFAQLVERLRRRNDVEVRVIDTARRGLLGRIRAVAQTMAAVLRADVVSLHASPPGIALAGPALLRCGRPLVVRVFGGGLDLDLSDPDSRIRRRIERVFARAALVLVETDQVATFMRSHFPGVRVEIQRNSRPVPRVAPLPPPGTKAFLFIGDVSEAKGARALAAAMRMAAPSGASLEVYGPVLDEPLRALLAETPGVRVRGPVANERIPELLAAADALVLPTSHAAEGHPGVILEAFGAGRAVIATRHRAIPEIVQHEANGILVPMGDIGALAAAIVRVASDPPLCATLGAAGFERAHAFEADTWSDRFVEHCRQAARRAAVIRNGAEP